MTTLVKICGLNSVEALDAALGAGADLVGFVRYPRSPRHLGLDEAGILSGRAKGRALRVALTVDASDGELADIVAALDPDLLQLHGDESPERVAAIRARFGRPVMKAVGIAEESDLAALDRYAGVADRLLLDAKPPKNAEALPGGNGLAFDWRLVAGLDPALAIMLSGGLAPENVAAAIELSGARALDVSSGIERRPGEKDPEKIERFVRAARAACAGPDERGHFGIFGGRFVAETLMPLILELEKAYGEAKNDPAFQAEMASYLTHYVGRPSPLYFAERLTEHLGGAKIYFKRDELNHTGAHKVN